MYPVSTPGCLQLQTPRAFAMIGCRFVGLYLCDVKLDQRKSDKPNVQSAKRNIRR